KSNSAISSEETSSKKKPAQAKKDVTSTKKPSSKPKSTKKKVPVKADKGKSLNVLSELALSKAVQLKEATKQSKKDFYISHASGSGDGTDFESRVLNEQQRKIFGTYEGTDNDDNDDNSDHERTESDRDENPNLNQSNTKFDDEKEESERVYTPPAFVPTHDEEKIDDKEKMNGKEDDEVTKELYKDVNIAISTTNKEKPFNKPLISEFATHVIERNITKSLEAAVLAKSSSQPKSTYQAAASLFEFELMKILMDKIKEHKSYLRADYKRELYDALVKSYNTDKDLFDTYGEVFMLKRSRDEKDKYQDPSTRSDQGMKRRKSSKDVKSSRDPKSKESKFASNRMSSKDVYSRKRIITVTCLDCEETALHDITSGIRKEYLPKRKWIGLDKRRAHVMIQDTDKQLFQRRLMRNLEKFIGGREY
nr:hypothetical protein [Tanacetum cinerariifolium]